VAFDVWLAPDEPWSNKTREALHWLMPYSDARYGLVALGGVIMVSALTILVLAPKPPA